MDFEISAFATCTIPAVLLSIPDQEYHTCIADILISHKTEGSKDVKSNKCYTVNLIAALHKTTWVPMPRTRDENAAERYY